jgi:TetR/AcrR family transcriptional regulator
MTPLSTKRLSFGEREARLLTAAGRLFSRLGYRGTTTRAIAEAAGINEALLFRHFPTKEALYDTLLHRTMEEWSQEVLVALEDFQNKPLHQALIEIAQIIINKVKTDPSLLRTVVFASLEGHRLGKGFYKKSPPIKSFMESFFKDRQLRGEIKKLDPTLLAATYLSLVFYYIHMKEIFGAEEFYFGQEKPTLEFFSYVLLEGVKS